MADDAPIAPRPLPFRPSHNDAGIHAVLRFGMINVVSLVLNHLPCIRVSTNSELLGRFKSAVQPAFVEAINSQADFLLNIRATSRDTNNDVLMIEAYDISEFEHMIRIVCRPHIGE